MKKYRNAAILAGFVFTVLPHLLYAEMTIKTPAWQKAKDLNDKGYYVFLFIKDNENADSKKMLTVIKEIKNKKEKKVDFVQISKSDAKEKKLIDFFKIESNPVVITLAPNGAITGYFVKTAVKDSLIGSLVSPKESEIIKNLQDGRVVFLCFHDKGSDHLKVQNEIEAVAVNFKGTVNAVYVNGGEEDLRKKVNLKSDSTTVLIIVPPGRVVAQIEGSNITKANLMRTLLSSCGSGCGSGCK